MSAPRITERRMGDVIGVIIPDARYDTYAVLTYAGIGEKKLNEERQAGRIRPRFYNGRNWYVGKDLIALIDGTTK